MGIRSQRWKSISAKFIEIMRILGYFGSIWSHLDILISKLINNTLKSNIVEITYIPLHGYNYDAVRNFIVNILNVVPNGCI